MNDRLWKQERRLIECERAMGISIGSQMEGGHRSAVFRCSTEDGTDAVLKLSATTDDWAAEAAALSAWERENAAVRLRAVDEPSIALALVLVLLVPGTPLPEGRKAEAVRVAAQLLPRLHRHPGAFPFPSLMARYTEFERRAQQDAAHEQQVLGNPEPVGLPLLPKARETASRLSVTGPDDVLLHGDFIDKNLLLDGDRYVAIDPIPMIGDPCSDVGFFAAYHPPASNALDCAADIATSLGYDEERALRWTAVWLTHQACETWRGDTEELRAVVRSARVGQLLEA